jgi:hypothetical protein
MDSCSVDYDVTVVSWGFDVNIRLSFEGINFALWCLSLV